MQDLCRKILAANFTIPDHVSPAARDLLLRMLTVDPTRRITLPEVRQLMQHCQPYHGMWHYPALAWYHGGRVFMLCQFVRCDSRNRSTCSANGTMHQLASLTIPVGCRSFSIPGSRLRGQQTRCERFSDWGVSFAAMCKCASCSSLDDSPELSALCML